MRKATNVILIVAVAVILFAVFQGLRRPTEGNVTAAVNTVRSELGFRPVSKDKYLTAHADAIALALALSADKNVFASYPALAPEYPPLRVESLSIDTDVIPTRVLGVTGKDVVDAMMKDQVMSEHLRDSRFEDIGVGIRKQNNGVMSVVIVLGQKKK